MNEEEFFKLLNEVDPQKMSPQLLTKARLKLDEIEVRVVYDTLEGHLKRLYEATFDINYELKPFKLTAEKYLATRPKERMRLLLALYRKRAQEKPHPARNVREPKYRNPNNPDQTWVGVGQRPMWYKEHLANGGRPEDLLIKEDER